ncbi:ornithine cyclodeaminase family protein, partial [Enterococcus hirae]
ANPDASVAAVIGAGVQARLQIEALGLVRDVRTVRVWARDQDKARAFAAEVAGRGGLQVTTHPDVAEAVADADIVVTTTPAT